MRILIVSDVSSHMRGGVPAEARHLIQGLVAHGHVVALASDAPLAGVEQVLHLPISIPVEATLAGEIGRAIASFRPEFVHVLCMSSKGVLQLAPLLRSRPWALTVHSVPPYERKLPRWHGHEEAHYGARALRFLAHSTAWRWVFHRGLVPRVIVHSEYVRDIVARYGCAPARTVSIPLPFETAMAAPFADPALRCADAPLMLTIGGLAHTKGLHDVVKAMPALLARFPRLRYQIIGEVRDASYLDHLHGLARSRGVTDHVLITPALSDADKEAALAQADVYVQPSHEEGFCLAYAEAAARVPRLVGTDTGAIAAISRHDVGARVVPVRRPQAIADAVSDLLRTALPDGHMAERAIRLSDRFSFVGYLQAHERLYALLLSQRRAAPELTQPPRGA